MTAAASWQALGTLVQLLVTDPPRLDDARRMLAEDLASIDAACSRFRPDSELVLACQRDGAVTVSELLAEAITVALRGAAITEGDVDLTVGGAMAALGYDRDFAALTAGDEPDGQLAAREVPGWRQVRFDPRRRRLELPRGIQLDLGATAKAWAADRSADRIAAALGCGVLVSLGGDTAVAGPPPDGGWQIRVQDTTGPIQQPPTGPAQVVAIAHGGLATSSTTARRWRRGGDELHHILNPRTGRPAEQIWRTVSVTARTCTDANIASTAAIIRGLRAPAWLTRLRLPARLVATDGQVRTVAGWPA